MSKASPEERLKALVVKRQQYSLEYEEKLSEVVEKLFEEILTKLEGDAAALCGEVVYYELRRTALDVMINNKHLLVSEVRVLKALEDKFGVFGVTFQPSRDQDIYSSVIDVELRIRLIP